MDVDAFTMQYQASLDRGAREANPAWGMTEFNSMETMNGLAFNVKLTFEGVPVGTIEERGNGGSPMLWMNDGRRSDMQLAWDAECARVFPDDDSSQEMLINALLTRAGF